MPLRERRARNATLYNPPTPGQPTTSASPHARRTRYAHTAHTLHIYATEFAQMLQALNTAFPVHNRHPSQMESTLSIARVVNHGIRLKITEPKHPT